MSFTKAVLDHILVQITVYLGLYFYRRPDQFLHPGAWNEDGEQIISNLETSGIFGLFDPVNGYLIVSSTLVNFISSRLSFDYYPEISAGLTIVVTFVLIKRLTRLFDAPFAFYLFLATFLLYPSDSEVLGIGLYTFWVFGLFAVCVFYVQIVKPGITIPAIDFGLLMIAMLSGPFGPISFALWFVLQFRTFDRRLWTLVGILALCCAVQAYTFLTTAQDDSKGEVSEIVGNVPTILAEFFGADAVAILPVLIAAGLLNTGIRASAFAGGLIAFAMFIAAYRVGDIRVLDQFGAGPRYFYYPYTIVILWALSALWLGNRTALHRVTRALSTTIIAALIVKGFPDLPRSQAYVDWRAEVDDCRFAVVGEPLRIYYDGTLRTPWVSPLTNVQCQRLVQASLLPGPQRSNCLPTQWREDRYYDACSSDQVPSNAKGADVVQMDGFELEGASYTSQQGGVDVATLELRVSQKALVAYRSGPETGEQFLEFRSHFDATERVPLEHSTAWRYISPPRGYTKMRVIDAGTAPGQWTAIAISE